MLTCNRLVHDLILHCDSFKFQWSCRSSFRKIVKRGQKLTVRKLWGTSPALLSHFMQCSQVLGGGATRFWQRGPMLPFATPLFPNEALSCQNGISLVTSIEAPGTRLNSRRGESVLGLCEDLSQNCTS